jgi:hypothetical protein
MTQAIPLWQAMVSLFGVIVVGLIGHMVSVAKLKTELDQKNFENSMRVLETHDAAYRTYTYAMEAYVLAPEPDYEDFMKVVSSGDVYFNQLNLICSTMISGKVDHNIRDKIWMPKIKVAFEKSLPMHYDTLRNAAKKRGFPYKGELRRRDHESIFAVAEMFSASDAWQRPHEAN